MNYHPEEIALPLKRQGLVANHESPLLDHVFFDHRRDMGQVFLPLLRLYLSSESLGKVFKANVSAIEAKVKRWTEAGCGLNQMMEIIGLVKSVIDQLLEVALPSGLEHEPKLKAVHLAATLNGLVARVVSNVVEFILLKQISGGSTIGLVEQPRVSCDEGRALEGRTQHFVRIPSNGIGQMRPSEQMFVLVGHDGASTPTRIHVKPNPMSLTNRGQAFEVVIRAHNCGSGRGVNKEGNLAIGDALLDGLLEFLRVQSSLIVRPDLDYVVGAQTKPVGSFDDGVMAFFRSVDHQGLA
eukprot:snap_masked-scaffold1459_size40432-processed-gene-0.0 protein:Tk02617 transcript:snap_masked-scaffold1459_size40432-processed-gene-0.0-mRNA-1 annotation:"l-aspartate oxidase"